MSRNPSDKNRGTDEDRKQNRQTEQDVNKTQEEQKHRQGESMARKQEGQKFVSDEDIIRRRTT